MLSRNYRHENLTLSFVLIIIIISQFMGKRKSIILFISLIAISLFLCISTFSLLANSSSYKIENILSNFFLNMPICLIIGAIDYKVISILQKNNSKYSASHSVIIDFILTALLICTLSIVVNYVLLLIFPGKFDILYQVLPMILWNSIIVLFIELFFYNKRQIENENKLNIIEKEKAIYQFEALKNQINPHFLFNSLNVLSSLAYQDAEKTNLFTKKLSNVYRYLLTTHDRPTVTLQEELQFVDSYLYLEQIRFGDTLQVFIENDKKHQDKAIIPASLQMLVENALKHNISTSKSPLIIYITINKGGVTVSNNIQLRSYVTKNGMGLNNLRKQYSLYDKEVLITEIKTNFIVKLPYI